MIKNPVMPNLPNSFTSMSVKKFRIALVLLTTLVLLLQLSSMAQPKKTTSKKRKQIAHESGSTLCFVIVGAEGGTFGYDILDHKKKMIHQPSVPGMPGNKGFAKKADAEKVAKLVMK